MKTSIFKTISQVTLDTVNEMYRTCDRIEIGDGKINGKQIDLDAYEAVLARVKINANLIGGLFTKGTKSQVLLKFKGVKRNFDVEVTKDYRIILTLQG